MSETSIRHQVAPELLRSIAGLRAAMARCREKQLSVGLVPTMGALHAGHLSLVRRCREECDITVVSIFVNPTQFAPDEDLARYPRNTNADVKLLDDLADLVFLPDRDAVYPPGFSTWVDPPAVSQPLEGKHRPGHFRGVSTVVLKLFNMVGPDRAFFGQKDFQQLRVIQDLVRDLDVPVEIVSCPIVRDSDGLALSSRNAYLDSDQRQRALALGRCLSLARERIIDGERDAARLMDDMREWLKAGGADRIDYAVVADPCSLQTMDRIRFPAVLLVAAHVGELRLIDNCILQAAD